MALSTTTSDPLTRSPAQARRIHIREPSVAAHFARSALSHLRIAIAVFRAVARISRMACDNSGRRRDPSNFERLLNRYAAALATTSIPMVRLADRYVILLRQFLDFVGRDRAIAGSNAHHYAFLLDTFRAADERAELAKELEARRRDPLFRNLLENYGGAQIAWAVSTKRPCRNL